MGQQLSRRSFLKGGLAAAARKAYNYTKKIKFTFAGYLKIALLLGILMTGILFVIKNFPVHYFSPEFIIFLNLCHLGLVMAFLFVNLYCLLFRKKWTTAR